MESTLKRERLLFDAALDIESPAERAAFLSRECLHDSKLRRRIERLLALHERAESFFNDCDPALSPVEREAANNNPAEAAREKLEDNEESGKRIGPYKLLQKLGEGGCGVVYMAEQQLPVRRRVALKIIKPGMDTRSVIARFEAERQALAMMDHSNIARVLDAGETGTGRPFFVMELVNGIRITRYCDERQLDTRQRLNLFIQVCQAIQHAHQKGIIHRDIKPSNILVTHHDGVPVPKVIDFGIAKATQEPLTEKTLFTIFGHFVGTPAYMSPEQAEMSGLDVDTRSDIYSLGVLLYELLTSKTPFDQKELLASGVDEMRRMLREREPHRPSTKLDTLPMAELTATALHRHAEPPKLQSLLRGDLDWIVMKALEKDRRRRYETANGLAMDVMRYLNDEPVVARPPSRIYRFQKLVRRNRSVFAAVGAVAVTLIIGLGISTWLLFRGREARQMAVVSEQRAEQARQNEANLRRESENREKVTQAALLVSNGKMEDADRLAEKFPSDKPRLESAPVLRALGKWHALNGRWQLAGDRFYQLSQINQLDGEETRSSDFCASVALAAAGNTNQFENFRHYLIGRFADEKTPAVAEQVLRASLLLPANANALAALQPLALVIAPPDRASVGNPSPLGIEEMVFEKLKLQNVGTTKPCSAASENGLITILAAGANIWDRRDEFAYAWVRVAGDFDFRMRVHRVFPMLDAYTRVGLMARESVERVDSRHVMVAVNATNSFQVITRSAEGAFATSVPQNPLPLAYGSNSWVRLQRVGAIFHAYTSSNGVDWAQLYQTTGGDTPFSEPIYFGVAACAHSTDSTATNIVSDFGATPTVSPDTSLTFALLEYRRGNAAQSADWCRRVLAYPECNVVQYSTARTILAMACLKLGQFDEAHGQLASVSAVVAKKFSGGLEPGSKTDGLWFEWVFIRSLLQQTDSPQG